MRALRRAGVAALVVVGLAACGIAVHHDVALPHLGTAASGGSAGGGASAGAPTPDLSVLTEPTAGYGAIDSLIATAHSSVRIEMYELADPTVEADLVADAERSVSVEVLLDSAYHGREVNTAAYAYLSAHGVAVRWSDPTEITHEKAVCVDTSVCAILTGNLTARYYPTSRDFVVLDRVPADVAAIEATFATDWTGAVPGPASPGADLVWSPGSAPELLALINGARHSLLVESEEMDETTITDALAAAARRGVHVEVAMTANAAYDAAFGALRAAGVTVSLYAPTASLYIHAKAIVVDSTVAFVGSENFSYASLDHNRELGIITDEPSVVTPIATAIEADVAGGARR